VRAPGQVEHRFRSKPEPLPSPEQRKPKPLLFRRPRKPPAAVATKLRASADALQDSIDRMKDPAIGRQNVTARRAGIAGNIFERSQTVATNASIAREPRPRPTASSCAT
jgi:hypothetical protein